MPSTTIKPASNEHLQQLVARVEAATGQDMPFLTLLIELQVKLVGGISGAVFSIPRDAQPRLLTVYPMAADGRVQVDPQRVEILRDCVERCSKARRLSVYRVGMGTSVHHAIATPMMIDGGIDGVTIVLTSPDDETELAPHLANVEWASRLYQGHVAQRRLTRHIRESGEAGKALRILRAAQQTEHFLEACMAVCNQTAEQINAARVSLGWTHGNTVHLRAMSGTNLVDRRQEVSLLLEAAMEESFDQARAVTAPCIASAEDDPLLAQAVARCHQQMLRGEAGQAVCSVPLRSGEQLHGVLTVQREGEVAFDGATVSLLQAIADLITPRLVDQYEVARPLPIKVGRAAARTAGRIVGPHHVAMKLVVLILLGLVAYSAVGRWDYRVEADFEFESATKTIYTAPFEGILKSVSVRKGDPVVKGQEIARLDEQEMDKKLILARAQLEKVNTRYMKSAGQTPSEQAWWRAARDEQAAEVRLYEYYLEHAVIRAEESGHVVSGDWMQRLGTRLERGVKLFEIGATDDLRVVMLVDERDIRHVKVAGSGTLAPTSDPSRTVEFKVARIVPQGEVSLAGATLRPHNVFEVYAELSGPAEQMKPGMKGIAKIEAGRKRVIWILTHKLVDYLRLALWW